MLHVLETIDLRFGMVLLAGRAGTLTPEVLRSAMEGEGIPRGVQVWSLAPHREGWTWVYFDGYGRVEERSLGPVPLNINNDAVVVLCPGAGPMLERFCLLTPVEAEARRAELLARSGQDHWVCLSCGGEDADSACSYGCEYCDECCQC